VTFIGDSSEADLIQGCENEAALIRLVLSDAQWERVAPLLPGKLGDSGRLAADNRRQTKRKLV
jgi:hypothetical protein